MNPMNLMFSFFFAKSSAEKYNIADSQKLQNTALLAGMVSVNPLLSYLIIDNEAKNLGASNTTVSGGVTTTTPLPTSGTWSCKYDALALEKKIKDVMVGTLQENISPSFLLEKDPKVAQLIEKITKDSFPVFQQQQIETINRIETDFKAIINSPFLGKLSSADTIVFESLKEIIYGKGLLDSCRALLNLSNSISQLNTYLIINVALSMESKVSHLKYEIEKLERGENLTSNIISTSDSISAVNPKTTVKQISKK